MTLVNIRRGDAYLFRRIRHCSEQVSMIHEIKGNFVIADKYAGLAREFEERGFR
jgi:hypothetical protein